MGWWWALILVCMGGKGGGHFFKAGCLIEVGAYSKKYSIIIFNSALP